MRKKTQKETADEEGEGMYPSSPLSCSLILKYSTLVPTIPMFFSLFFVVLSKNVSLLGSEKTRYICVHLPCV